MVKVGIWDTFVAERPSAAGQVRVREAKPDEPKLSKKAQAKAAAAAEEAAAPSGKRSSRSPTSRWRKQLRGSRAGGRSEVPVEDAPADAEAPSEDAPADAEPSPSRSGRRGSRGSSAVRDLVDFLVSELVDDPDAVEVTESEDDRGFRYTVHVAPDDMGKVIGKGGRTAKAIRAVVRAAGDPPGRERLRRHRRLRCPSRPSSSVTSRRPTASEARSPWRSASDNPDRFVDGAIVFTERRPGSLDDRARPRARRPHARAVRRRRGPHGGRGAPRRGPGRAGVVAARARRGRVLAVPARGVRGRDRVGTVAGLDRRGDPEPRERPLGRDRRRGRARPSCRRSAT